jgi:radical SAM protein with 4Fe4S-binding SPASM domain
MDLGLYIKVLKEIGKLTPEVITLHLAGEPLIHRDLDILIKLAKEAGIKTQFATNGTLLSGEMADKILSSELDAFNIAFCENSEVFSKLRGGADWNIVYNNIVDFLNAKERTGKKSPFVQIDNIDTDNKSSLDKLKTLFSGLRVDKIADFQVHTWSGDYATEKKDDPFFTKMMSNKYYPCSHLWTSMIIRWNGDVVACCRDLESDYILGNVKDEPLIDIWNNSKAVALRKIHTNKEYRKVKICRNCTKLWEGEKPYHLILKHIKNIALRMRFEQ